MTIDADAAKRRLVDLLGSVAAYNDKGAQWCGHGAADIEATQRAYQQDLLEAALSLGPGILGEELVSAIEGGAASRDASGDYASLAERVLGVRRVPPTQG